MKLYSQFSLGVLLNLLYWTSLVILLELNINLDPLGCENCDSVVGCFLIWLSSQKGIL